ncbi:MAG TPA: hypothetical protein VLD63_03670 [Anaerolineales bacterium]|nr:hypothetical protein [Anaerolineales bacterium]
MRGAKELILALVAVLAITGLYSAALAVAGVPAASGFLGHSLGVLGFVLMLMTETLYSLRKRAVRRPWGTMRSWLQFHIFTGIVGPYLVFLHSAWSFRGLAGALMLMTAVVVASGFLGRYIYTAVPRTADGAVVEAEALKAALAQARTEVDTMASGGAAAASPKAVEQARHRLKELERQLDAMRWARRLLATWHTVHIPLGMVMFVTAFVHAGAALYYATLLR